MGIRLRENGPHIARRSGVGVLVNNSHRRGAWGEVSENAFLTFKKGQTSMLVAIPSQ